MKLLKTLSIASVMGAIALSGNVLADNVCKGMVENECAASNACRWVDSYKRKDGRDVQGYCRNAPRNMKDISGMLDNMKKPADS